jgi:hypothetical protein
MRAETQPGRLRAIHPFSWCPNKTAPVLGGERRDHLGGNDARCRPAMFDYQPATSTRHRVQLGQHRRGRTVRI